MTTEALEQLVEWEIAAGVYGGGRGENPIEKIARTTLEELLDNGTLTQLLDGATLPFKREIMALISDKDSELESHLSGWEASHTKVFNEGVLRETIEPKIDEYLASI